MIDCLNLVGAQPESSERIYSQSRIIQKQRLDVEESVISTDYDLYLESEEEDQEDDYRSTFSTFSALLIRRLRALEHQQAHEQDPQAEAINVRPPLLAIADDSYSAKMERVFRWTRAVSAAPSEEVSSDSDYSPPPMTRKRRLSDSSSPDDTSSKRVRTSDGLSPAAPGSPLLPPKSRLFHLRPEYTLHTIDIPSKAYLPRNNSLRHCIIYPARPTMSVHVCTACDTIFPSPQRLRHHGRSDACRAAVTYGLE
ncbi:hypothetical protein M422DRAFT_23787 [Sphaerobolus stellatus SS14]|nr:hypothetical protein M422DRAFT_23787 [Sphaerobolus stellatus SS14]